MKKIQFMCDFPGTSLRPDASVLAMLAKYLLKELAIVSLSLKLHNCFLYFDENNLKCIKQSFIFS